ncbi:MAG: hypothetical protein JWL61_2343 [Gemmatimonadetes bacterium]|nr:hypothetical protein [Gemmatimonadota bacterium]
MMRLFESQEPISMAAIHKHLAEDSHLHGIEPAADAATDLPIFVEQIHEAHKHSTAQLLADGVPRVLCRPSTEGKSTELNYIACRFEARPLDGKQRIGIRFGRSAREFSRSQVFAILAERLQVKRCASLKDAIEATRATQLLLTCDNIEQLPDDALAWLLASVKDMGQDKEFLQQRGVCIVLAGSMGLAHSARNVYSHYFADEAAPRVRDYNATDLEDVNQQLRKRANVGLSDDAIAAVMLQSAGDKRLANMILEIGVRAHLRKGDGEEAQLERGEIDAAVEHYTTIVFRTDRRWQRALESVLTDREAWKALRDIVRGRDVLWAYMPPSVRGVLFRCGLLDVEAEAAKPKNAIIERLLHSALRRQLDTRSFVKRWFASDSEMPGSTRERRKSTRAFLQRQAISGWLMWLFYAEVVARDDTELTLRFVDAKGNEAFGKMALEDFGFDPEIVEAFIKYCIWTPHGLKEIAVPYA